MNIKKIQGKIPMHFKKIIPFSLVTIGALCVAGALSACSDKVAGADEQVNTMAQNSSSSVTPGSSDSFDKNDFLARFGNHKSGVPVINIVSYKDSLEHFKRVDGSIDSVYTMVIADSFVDSINARETYNNIVDSILENAFVPIDEAASHSFRDVHVRFLGEDSMGLYIELFDGGVSCGFGSTHPENDDMLVSEFYSHGVEKTGDSLFVVRRMLSFDTSIVEQFKDECIAEGGSFGVNMVVIYDEPLEQWPVGHKCSLRASLTDSVYKDPYWEKYISKVLDRCIVDFSDN
jgi:hypothetical protein